MMAYVAVSSRLAKRMKPDTSPAVIARTLMADYWQVQSPIMDEAAKAVRQALQCSAASRTSS